MNLVDLEKKDPANLDISDLISFQGSQWKLWRKGVMMIRSRKNGLNPDYGIMSIWYEDMTKREFYYQINCQLDKSGLPCERCLQKVQELNIANPNGGKTKIVF